jgi:hypothetical protein
MLMKTPFVFAIPIMLLLSSCSTFQYVSVDSELSKNELNQFVYENDTLRIKYWFSGQNCPMQIEVFNKLNQPLQVDWKKSALISDEIRFAYWKDESVLNASSYGQEIQWINHFSTASSLTEGTLTRNEQISFIPPLSLISISPLLVKTQLFILPQPLDSQKIILNDYGLKGWEYFYTPETSPLQFRSFLTISIGENSKNPIYIDHNFWISDILQTTAPPNSILNKKDVNRFYLKRLGAGPATLGITAVAGEDY